MTFENQHERRIGVYLVNALVPEDTTIHVIAQNRNAVQSEYSVNYSEGGVVANGISFSLGNSYVWLSLLAVVSLVQLVRVRRRSRSDANART